MEFRDLVGKLYGENTIKESTVDSTEVQKESSLPSLKKIFESLSQQVDEAIPAGMKPLAILDPQNKSAGAGVVKSSNPAVQKMLGSLDPKDVQIVMTTQGTGTAGTTPTTQTGGTAMKEEELDEKWAGAAKVKPTGQYKDKTKEELKSMLASLKKSGPHGKDSPAAKKMRQINFALRAKGGWKSGEGAAMKEEQIEEKAKNPYAIGMAAAKKSAGITKKHATDLPKSVVVKGHEIAKKIKKKENMKEGEIASTKSQDTMGAGLGAGRSSVALESIQVNESMNKKHRAAYQEGQADGLRERACRVKHYEDMEEAKHYYEGWKAGLDECYGMGVKQEPITGMEEAVAAMEAGIEEMDKTAYMKQQAIKTPGPTFKAFGQTMHDKDVLETNALAFESLDKQLAELLKEDAEPVVEGLSVSMSTGQQGSPDSVSVTGTDDEAGKLLAFIKQVGLGGMGGDKPMVGGEEPAVVATVSDYGAPKFAGHDNPDMKALLQKVGAGDEDYKDEEGHEHGEEAKHGEPCNECGMTEGCGCSKEPVEEVQTQDQKLYATTESDDSEDDGFDASARNTELDNDAKPASGGATNENMQGEEQLALDEDGAEAPGSDPEGEKEEQEAEDVAESEELTEWANNAGGKGTDTAFEQDIEFMTKVISGGLNKPKVTGQTTIPVIAHQDARDGTKEDLNSWIKLAGVKPAVKK